jgi:hypothetical protein
MKLFQAFGIGFGSTVGVGLGVITVIFIIAKILAAPVTPPAAPQFDPALYLAAPAPKGHIDRPHAGAYYRPKGLR